MGLYRARIGLHHLRLANKTDSGSNSQSCGSNVGYICNLSWIYLNATMQLLVWRYRY